MKIWIDLDNSPHVPLFVPIIEALQKRGYEVVITARDAFQVRELADLYGLARSRLIRSGVERVSGGGHCTYEDAPRFFSYRRERDTGRMATVVWLAG